MENLGIDPKLLIAQIVNFLLFFWIFSKFIAKPLSQFIAKQKHEEQEKERLLLEAQEKYDKIVEDERVAREKIRVERENVVAEAKKAAESVKSDIIKEATREAEEIVQKAMKQMEAEKKALYDDVRNKTIDLSIFIVDQALKHYLTTDLQKKVTAHIVRNMANEVKNIDQS